MYLKKEIGGVVRSIELTPEEVFTIGREYVYNRALQDYNIFLQKWDGAIPNSNQKNLILEGFVEDMETMNLQEWDSVMRDNFIAVVRNAAIA